MKHVMITSAMALVLSAGAGVAGSHLPFGEDDGRFSWDSYNAWAENAPDLSGQTVTISGPWLQPEDTVFRSVAAYFAEATGAEVSYVGSDSFEQNIVIDLESGSAANIAPQRPKPAWTSSSTRTMPCWRVTSRRTGAAAGCSG